MADSMMSRQMREWLEASVENGLFAFDSRGKAQLSPRVQAVVEALHEVLAGGEVTIATKVPGNASRKQALHEKMNILLAAVSEKPGVTEFVP